MVHADRYEKVAVIGSGACGTTGETVAIKEIQLEGSEWDDSIVDEVRREVALLAQCDAPSILRYRGSVLAGTALWIVTEHCALGSVRQMLDAVGPLDEHAATYVVREVASALAYIHGAGVAHRDVKAANVLLAAGGRVRLGDFGVAAAPLLGGTDGVAGSPYWMAPEAVRALSGNVPHRPPAGASLRPNAKDAPYDHAAADIWSLGILLVELLTGAPPLAKLPAARALALIPSVAPPRLDPARFSAEVCELAAQCLHDDASRRPSASALLRLRVFRSRSCDSSAMAPYVVRYERARGEDARDARTLELVFGVSDVLETPAAANAECSVVYQEDVCAPKSDTPQAPAQRDECIDLGIADEECVARLVDASIAREEAFHASVGVYRISSAKADASLAATLRTSAIRLRTYATSKTDALPIDSPSDAISERLCRMRKGVALVLDAFAVLSKCASDRCPL